MTEALVGLGLMMVLALLRIPIAIAMGVVGFLGVAYLRDWNFAPAFAMVETKVYETGRNYTLSVVPLFILMGNLVTRAGMSQELFRAAYTCIGHLRGGLAMATVCACAGFGAICGSSIATAATMAKVAYPAMSQLGYSDRLSTGAIAGGGTLGILIPPSTIMVIYGVHDRDQHRQAVRGRHPAGHSGDVPAVPRGAMDRVDRSGLGAARRALDLGAAARGAQGRVGGGDALHRRHGRHLRRRLHGHRRRGDRRLRRALLRAGAPGAHLAHAARFASSNPAAPRRCCSPS